MMQRLFIWAEIPVSDIGRAKAFYERIFQTEILRTSMGDAEYAFFPVREQFNGGALVQERNRKPSADGVTLFLDGGPDLTTILERVRAAGGQVIMEKTYSEHTGFLAMFIDSEGNRIGLQHL